MSVFAFVERSIHSCPQCGLGMLTGITEDDDGANHRLVHWCECCRVDYPDGVWRVDIAECHKAVARFKAMTSAEVDAVLAGRGSMAKQLTEMRLG